MRIGSLLACKGVTRCPALVVVTFLVASCGRLQADPPTEYVEIQKGVSVSREEADKVTGGKMFGEGGINVFGRETESDRAGGGIGVNAFLWRASLDSLAFMPMASADPFGGVIISDWYSPAQAPEERFKVTVYILDTRLRADGVKVALFKQNRDPIRGVWVDAAASATSATDLENAILTRARALRLASAAK